MPFLEGGDLEAALTSRDRPLTTRERLRIALDCAEGIAALHARNLVHRDLKPANVLLSADRRAVRLLLRSPFTSASDCTLCCALASQ